MAQAERDPASFSATLSSTLPKLSVPALVSGLAWTHELPAVTQRGRELITQAISVSASTPDDRNGQKLFDAAQHAQTNRLSMSWLELSGRSGRGLRRFGECFDAFSNTPFGLRCGLHYLSQSEWARTRATEDVRKKPRSKLRFDPQREERAAEAAWQAYVKVRRGAPAAGGDDAAFDIDQFIRRQVRMGDVFAERLERLVRTEMDTGIVPPEEELELVIARHRDGNSLSADLLRWSESSVSEVRLFAFQTWWKHASYVAIADESIAHARVTRARLAWAMSDEDVAHARRILLTLATDPAATAVLNVPVLLNVLRRGVAPADAARFVELTDHSNSDPSWLSLLAGHADEFQSCRDALTARLSGENLDVAQRAADVSHKSQTLQRFIGRLILALDADDLRDEEMQERLIIWASALGPDEGQLQTGAEFPPSRREHEAHGVTNFCGFVGRTPSLWEREKQRDLEAFGLRPKPPPTTAPGHFVAAPASPRRRIPAAWPMLSPDEKVERWENFARGLQRLQRKLGRRVR